jgi:uncharacterized protein (TIGR02271 family)
MQTTTTRTVIGVFDDFATAQRVAGELIQAGFSRSNVEVQSSQSYAQEAARGNAGLMGDTQSDSSGGVIGGFFRRLFGDDRKEEFEYYSEAVRRGSAIVSVSTDESNAEQAAEILDRNGAIDIDERAESWKQRGFHGYDASAPAFNREEVERERNYYGEGGRERNIPVVNEELHVGKRQVQRGGVRIYNTVREQPVEEEITLREEHVRVDRRPADRPATEADLKQQQEVIDVTEMAEEAVVQKNARVVEEVVINKDVEEHTEKIRDTVRRSDVNVEPKAGRTSKKGTKLD